MWCEANFGLGLGGLEKEEVRQAFYKTVVKRLERCLEKFDEDSLQG